MISIHFSQNTISTTLVVAFSRIELQPHVSMLYCMNVINVFSYAQPSSGFSISIFLICISFVLLCGCSSNAVNSRIPKRREHLKNVSFFSFFFFRKYWFKIDDLNGYLLCLRNYTFLYPVVFAENIQILMK